MAYSIRLKEDTGPTTSGLLGQPLEIENCGTLRLLLDVTAASGGSPTLDAEVQHSPDKTTWATLGTAFAQKTSTGSEHKVLGPSHRYVRLKYTLGGSSPSFRFTVIGEGV